MQRATNLESDVESYGGGTNFESDSNEDDFAYSLHDWNPDSDRSRPAIPIVHHTAAFPLHDPITDKACMDTGANTSVANWRRLVTLFLQGSPALSEGELGTD
eukprot:546245-Rhodomonas_salina.1